MADEPEHHRDLGYTETEFPAQQFSVAESERGLTISGTCPACGGRTVTTLGRGSPEGAKGFFRRGAVRTSAAPRTVTVYCECGHVHADRPADAIDAGCGAFWDVELP
ncbi:hypothetical protein BTM25_20340 [Actinomadura rubteroloni]|uniref:Uncharacterized protein n=1 Tax=Actinomadura rubteroloni TaxID=1926885 RepID=A0A2P4URE1_9ACTN|nr:hypothetical protein [Actinomadura rubteroloni]POM27618.1 hypothetical protein BTM25_20340 [Actinomadura rubteroloni]